MLCPLWLLAVAVVGVFEGVKGQCWEKPHCQDLTSESNILECIELCRSDLTAEYPVFPGEMHLQPVSDFNSPPPSSPLSALSPSSVASTSEQQSDVQSKRSYSMEHFRWGKPVGRKRRPVKVYTNGVEEESSEAFPSEMRRALGNKEPTYPSLESGATEGGEPEGLGREADNLGGVFSLQEKKDGSYKMKHFRWSGPPATKRYGGFMKSWDERTQKPLLTLFKNVIIKDGQQKREQ
ncbi:proopiomelanocortin a [Esox lucius]|uniref:Met-enkephalin n=1 Tax=Esox lucius TaxID=8010 RepID=A0AAY5L1I7_ESOLU|nr:proopiomelanocortin a [Esox lucius]